ncbi:MAG: DUF1127 domain-containing protein [Bacteroidota bacterium]
MFLSDWMGSIFLSHSEDAPSPVVRLFDGLGVWLERSRQRATLGQLDERMLADIGCDHATAVVEADKPFWRE